MVCFLRLLYCLSMKWVGNGKEVLIKCSRRMMLVCLCSYVGRYICSVQCSSQLCKQFITGGHHLLDALLISLLYFKVQ